MKYLYQCARCYIITEHVLEPCFGWYKGRYLCRECEECTRNNRLHTLIRKIDYQFHKIYVIIGIFLYYLKKGKILVPF